MQILEWVLSSPLSACCKFTLVFQWNGQPLLWGENSDPTECSEHFPPSLGSKPPNFPETPSVLKAACDPWTGPRNVQQRYPTRSCVCLQPVFPDLAENMPQSGNTAPWCLPARVHRGHFWCWPGGGGANATCQRYGRFWISTFALVIS